MFPMLMSALPPEADLQRTSRNVREGPEPDSCSAANRSVTRSLYLFLIDYTQRQRVKIWGEARVADDADLAAKLMPEGYKARAEQAIPFTVSARDTNCQQHIARRFEAADVSDGRPE
jgi:predicted pyridoxine 5'-phosphate oxidase superfamily flavin-nucleotide-binding protein